MTITMAKRHLYILIIAVMLYSSRVSAKPTGWLRSSSLTGIVSKNDALWVRGGVKLGNKQNKTETATPPAPAAETKLLNKDTLQKSICALAGTVGTYYLNNDKGMGPIRGAMISALISTILLPDNLALASLCGCFAGMCKTSVVPGGIGAAAVLGAMNGVMLSFFDQRELLLGLGGRLGVIACISSVIFFIVDPSVQDSSETAAVAALIGDCDPFKDFMDGLLGVIALTCKGAFQMRIYKWLLSNPVAAVGATGLAASYYLPPHKVAPVCCGAITAMAAPSRVPTLTALFWAAVFAGMAQQSYECVLLGGFGGKLGVSALTGCVMYSLLLGRGKKEEEGEKEA